MDAVALIPAYKPQELLLPLVAQLRAAGFPRVIVVDDGGGALYASLFDRIAELEGVDVLRHEVNRGKGAAIKTGLAHYIGFGSPGSGIVTIDADGQHRVEDARAVAQALQAHPDRLVIGVRDFSG